jgi:hypothetical protein
MSKITDKLIFDLIKQHYRPYDTHREFAQGFAAYQTGHLNNPHEADSISAQAWDVSIPRQSRGLYDVSRSKRLVGVADAILGVQFVAPALSNTAEERLTFPVFCSHASQRNRA